MMNPANLIGKTLDQFRLDEYIGRGAMGVVYKATDTILRRSVALKLIPKGFEASTPAMAEARKRLIQEAQAAGCLTHPNIVTIHAYGETDEFQYICMEYIVGKTLAEVISERKILPIEEAVPIVEQVLMALDRANQEGIVHRDIKPANIMILEDKRVKVMDFGIAKIPSLSTTTTGTVLGTPYYMSPEQISGQKVDILSDIFSVGAVFYQIITGTRPFEGETTVTLAYKIVQVEPVPPKILNIHIPQEIDNICKKALAKDPSIRYQTPVDMLQDLRAFMAKGATAKRPVVVSPMLDEATVKTQAPILPPRQEPMPLSEDRTIPLKDIPYTKPAAVEVKPEVVEKKPPEPKPIPPVVEKKPEPAPVPPVAEKKAEPVPIPPVADKKPVSAPVPPIVEKKPETVVKAPAAKKETVPSVMAQTAKPSSAQDKKSGSPSKAIAIAVVALLVLVGGGFGLVRYLRSTGPAPESTPAKAPQVTQNVPKPTEPTPPSAPPPAAPETPTAAPPGSPPAAPPATTATIPPATPPGTQPAAPPETPPVSPAKAKQDALVLKAKNQIKSNPANARKLLDQVLAEAPDHFEATYQLARLLTFQKDFQNAIQAYQKAQQLNKKMPEIPFNLGFIFMSQGDFDQAITYYEQCRNLKPRFLDEVLTNEGFCFLQKNNQQKAKTLFAEAVKVNPKNRIARNYLKNNGGQP